MLRFFNFEYIQGKFSCNFLSFKYINVHVSIIDVIKLFLALFVTRDIMLQIILPVNLCNIFLNSAMARRI